MSNFRNSSFPSGPPGPATCEAMDPSELYLAASRAAHELVVVGG